MPDAADLPELLPPAPRPCKSCPYRRDVPAQVWHPDEYAKLCLAQPERLLTADLHWRPAGDIRAGDEVMAFGPGERGQYRRIMMPATVTRSEPSTAECVRVITDDGAEVVCTTDHPWLVTNVRHDRRFVEAAALLRGLSTKRGDRRRVVRLFDTWHEDTSRDGGWLAGMYDGEGSLKQRPGYGAELSLHQNPGPVLAHAEQLLIQRGFKTIYHHTTRKTAHALMICNTADVARALGSLRPMRLLAKWNTTRACRAIGTPQVVAVEPAGTRDIQVITTTAGTYIGEGFAMHNCGYDKPTAEQPLGVFRCHQNGVDDPRARVCAGWAHVHGRNPRGHELLALRLAVTAGLLTRADVEATERYGTDVPCFATGLEAAEHGTGGEFTADSAAMAAAIVRRRPETARPRATRRRR